MKYNQSKIESLQRPVLPDLSSIYHQEIERRVEYILRNLISSPIKGEITKSKLRARKIELVYLDDLKVTSEMSTEGGIIAHISQTVYVTEKGGKKYYLSEVKLLD